MPRQGSCMLYSWIGVMEQTLSYQAFLASPHHSIKHTSYFETYDRLFSPYRGRPITFVEVGVLSGGSLFMWREFFGKDARIIGVDLNPNAKKWEASGFEIHIGSQSDPAFWRNLRQSVGQIDILLDDGGHSYAQQIITTESMLDAIRDGGLLVVEDTHTSYMDGFGPKKYFFIEYAKLLVDRINHRSGTFEGSKPETRIWSAQFFESIVAFHINRSASTEPSSVVANGKASDGAADYRNFDRRDPWIDAIKGPLRPLLRLIPGSAAIKGWLRDRRETKRYGLDRFF